MYYTYYYNIKYCDMPCLSASVKLRFIPMINKLSHLILTMILEKKKKAGKDYYYPCLTTE